MALIGMCVFDTKENNRTEYTIRTVNCLLNTIDLKKHRLFIIDNNSCKETKDFLYTLPKFENLKIFNLSENIGHARGINTAWKERNSKEHCIRIDNDVIIYNERWVEQLEEVVEIDNTIGICGLKRKDLSTNNKFSNISNNLGKEILVEEVETVIGTCQLSSWRLLDKIGYLFQMGLYGYEDLLASERCKLAGFKSVYLPHINIDHIDTGENPYTQEKIKQANSEWEDFLKIKDEYINGTRNIYQDIY